MSLFIGALLKLVVNIARIKRTFNTFKSIQLLLMIKKTEEKPLSPTATCSVQRNADNIIGRRLQIAYLSLYTTDYLANYLLDACKSDVQCWIRN